MQCEVAYNRFLLVDINVQFDYKMKLPEENCDLQLIVWKRTAFFEISVLTIYSLMFDLKFNINRNSLETWFESLARNVENQKGMIILFAVY